MKAEESSNKVSKLISEISAASGDQANRIEQINTAVTEIDRATQNSAANAEESASASVEMNAQTVKMRLGINELHAIIYGRTDTLPEAPPRKHGSKKPASSSAPRSRKTTRRSLPEPSSNSKKLKPAEVIPMDDEDDFTDF
jgi:methyl-accepting chemotaxis protein